MYAHYSMSDHWLLNILAENHGEKKIHFTLKHTYTHTFKLGEKVVKPYLPSLCTRHSDTLLHSIVVHF